VVVGVDVRVPVAVGVWVGDGVVVRVGVFVAVFVGEGDCVGLGVAVAAGVRVAVLVQVAVAVEVAVRIAVRVTEAVAVGSRVAVAVGVAVNDAVAVEVGEAVGTSVDSTSRRPSTDQRSIREAIASAADVAVSGVVNTGLLAGNGVATTLVAIGLERVWVSDTSVGGSGRTEAGDSAASTGVAATYAPNGTATFGEVAAWLEPPVCRSRIRMSPPQ
jgi:hypothetical protein